MTPSVPSAASALLAVALGLVSLLTARLLLRYVAQREPGTAEAALPAAGGAFLVVAVVLGVLPLLWRRPLAPASAIQAGWVAALAVIFAVDLRVRYILDIFTAPLAAIAILAAIAVGRPEGASVIPPLLGALAGAAIGLALFGLFFGLGLLVFRQAALGLGDVKLAALLGLILGANHVLTALFTGVFLGGAVSLALVLLRRARLGDAPAYGTYLALGGYAALLQAAGWWR